MKRPVLWLIPALAVALLAIAFAVRRAPERAPAPPPVAGVVKPRAETPVVPPAPPPVRPKVEDLESAAFGADLARVEAAAADLLVLDRPRYITRVVSEIRTAEPARARAFIAALRTACTPSHGVDIAPAIHVLEEHFDETPDPLNRLAAAAALDIYADNFKSPVVRARLNERLRAAIGSSNLRYKPHELSVYRSLLRPDPSGSK